MRRMKMSDISEDEEDSNKSLTIKDFADFLNKEENKSLRFLLRLQLYKMGYYDYMKKEDDGK